MIRTIPIDGGIVPRERADDRSISQSSDHHHDDHDIDEGSSDLLITAGSFDFEDLRREAAAIEDDRRRQEAALADRLTRTILIDAFLQVRRLNGLDKFTQDDLDDLDQINTVAALIEQRRARPGAQP